MIFLDFKPTTYSETYVMSLSFEFISPISGLQVRFIGIRRYVRRRLASRLTKSSRHELTILKARDSSLHASNGLMDQRSLRCHIEGGISKFI